MSWKPSEIEIIDYLYGEMSPELDKKFAKYKKSHPGFAKEVEEFQKIQNLLKKLPDEEVIPPLPIVSSPRKFGELSGERKWRYPVSIAASIAALLMVGYFTKFSISMGNDGFKLGFNQPQAVPIEALTKEDILKIIDTKVSLVSNEWQSGMADMQTTFAAQLQQNKRLTEAEINRVAATRAKTSIDDEQILAFITQLQDENKKAMQTFYQVTAEEQQKYMQNILLDFNEYLVEQRQKDMQFIQANMLELKSTSALKQEETDKILASIITTVNKQNSIGR